MSVDLARCPLGVQVPPTPVENQRFRTTVGSGRPVTEAGVVVPLRLKGTRYKRKWVGSAPAAGIP